MLNSRWTGRSAGPLASRARAPPSPRDTSRQDCGRAAAGTGSSRWRAGSYAGASRGLQAWRSRLKPSDGSDEASWSALKHAVRQLETRPAQHRWLPRSVAGLEREIVVIRGEEVEGVAFAWQPQFELDRLRGFGAAPVAPRNANLEELARTHMGVCCCRVTADEDASVSVAQGDHCLSPELASRQARNGA